MKKTLTGMFTFALVVPFLVHADAISDLRLQLQNVLTRIAELQKELVLVESGITPSADGKICITLTKDLTLGMNNNEVKTLQSFLAQDASIYPEGTASGYFGSLTQRAVERWQMRYGVVSSGTPSTTGFGVVGPKTRNAINSACQGAGGAVVSTGANNVVDMTFEKNVVTAPADARLKLTLLEPNCMSYRIYWGDGSAPTTKDSGRTTNCGSVLASTLTHRYIQPGSYTATIYTAKGTLSAVSADKATISTNITVAVGEPRVRVISPNGDENLSIGDTASVKWEVANKPADSALVFYVVTPQGTYRFKKGITDGEAFNWIVGDRVCDGNGCSVELSPGSHYKIRAVLYTPANACIDFCTADSVSPRIVATDESDDTFTLETLGSGGDLPLLVENTSGQAPYTVAAQVVIAPIAGGESRNFEVDFGDGSAVYTVHIPAGEDRVTERNFSHTYAQAGRYAMRLRPAGATQYIAQQEVRVTEPSLTLTPQEGAFVPVRVQATFDVDDSCSYNGEMLRVYTVNWDDSSETSRYEVVVPKCSSDTTKQSLRSKSFTHDFDQPGAYNVKLGIDSDKNSYTSVIEQLDLERSTLTVSPTFGFKPLKVSANYRVDSACTVGSAAQVTYTTSWGDGTADDVYTITPGACGTFTSSLADKTVTHTFQEIGTYTVRLTIRKSNLGDEYTTTRTVVVDKSALRNGFRAVATAIGAAQARENFAAVLQSFLTW